MGVLDVLAQFFKGGGGRHEADHSLPAPADKPLPPNDPTGLERPEVFDWAVGGDLPDPDQTPVSDVDDRQLEAQQ